MALGAVRCDTIECCPVTSPHMNEAGIVKRSFLCVRYTLLGVVESRWPEIILIPSHNEL